ncbi:MAG: hypothetical protein D3925_01450 [Candidatus Electrothrix sp. AR5]|nr:hypothetical protein [Candidatus Electrothrix sp. AR5]
MRHNQFISSDIEELKKQWKMRTDKLSRLEQQRIAETRVEEIFRLEQGISKEKDERKKLEQEILRLEEQANGIAMTTDDAEKVHLRHNDKKKPSMHLKINGKRWAIIILSIVSLSVAVGMALLLVFAESFGASLLLQDRLFYICLLLMGTFSAFSFFGFTRLIFFHPNSDQSNYRLNLQLGVPTAIACLVVFSGFYLIPRDSFFDVTVRAVDKNGVPVFSERKASVLLKNPNLNREADFTKNGEATIKKVPSSFRGTEANVFVQLYFYKQIDVTKKYKLNEEAIEVELKFDSGGTNIGIINKRNAHLEVVKLLLPFRLMSVHFNKDAMETYYDQYYSKDFMKFASKFNLRSKIEFSKEDLISLCDVLSEYSPESLEIRGDEYLYLINFSAVRFKRSVTLMSQIDSEGIDPVIQNELIKISKSNFVSRAASINPNSKSNNSYLDDGFWKDFSYEIRRISDNNIINLFSEFSGF